MKISQKILTEISQITREIEDKYPELQKYLDELPITLSDDDNKVEKMDEKMLKEYLENLKSIVKKYKKEY
jgi:division protein CdvB (Snf7/Vps24/ESCRT-III family)